MSDEFYSIGDLELHPGTGTKKLDYANWDKVQKSIDANLEKTAREEAAARIRENTKTWLNSIPKKWRASSIKDSPNFLALKEMLKKRRLNSFFIGEGVVSGTNTAYGILRVFVSRGWVKPGQIAVASEDDLMAASTSGFKGAEIINNFLNHGVFVIILGSKEMLEEKERATWGRIIDQCFHQGNTLIIVSSISLEEFSSGLSKTAADKLFAIMGENVIAPSESDNSSYNEKEKKFDRFKD